MDFTNRISRTEIAEPLRVQTQTIAKWERMETFPQAKEHVSDRLILYDGNELFAKRLAEKTRGIPPRRP